MTEATVNKEMTISDILGNWPHKSQKLAQEITNMGLHCVGCGAATYETLEAGMLGHGMSEEDVQELVDRLNEVLAEKQDLSSITLTKRAAKKFLEICQEEGKGDLALRFGDKPGGCSGFEYVLDFSKEAKPNDAVLSSNGVTIHIDNNSLKRLMGSEIDFFDGLNGAGFKISNPNAKSSCGCGNSQSY
jgi:iron-sulfur cluster assembly protein